MDMNADGSPLTSRSVLNRPDGERWLLEHDEEIVRLIESKTGRINFLSSVPKEKKLAYFNPQLRIKLRDVKLQYSVKKPSEEIRSATQATWQHTPRPLKLFACYSMLLYLKTPLL